MHMSAVRGMLKVYVAIRLLKEGGERVGQRTAEAKGINSEEITPDIPEEVKELASEVKQEVKEATAEVMGKVLTKKGAPQQVVSLRETVSSEGFDEKRGL